jgi:hypothetical protein
MPCILEQLRQHAGHGRQIGARFQPRLWAAPADRAPRCSLLEFDHGSRRTKLLIHVMQLSIAQVCWAFERGSGGLLPPPCL